MLRRILSSFTGRTSTTGTTRTTGGRNTMGGTGGGSLLGRLLGMARGRR